MDKEPPCDIQRTTVLFGYSIYESGSWRKKEISQIIYFVCNKDRL